MLGLNTTSNHTTMVRYDDEYLFPMTGIFVNFDNATFMTDLYFSDSHTLVIKGIEGEKHFVNMDTLEVTFMPGDPFPEIYIAPYWYSQPTNDTLFVHDKHGSKYLFDLGHPIEFMGQSQDHLVFISPAWKDPDDKNCQGATAVCNTFW